MTREEILAMKAGIDLDAKVAEKIMGKQLAPEYGEGMYLFGSGNTRIASHIDPYSTDISAAWLVVEKLRTLDTYIEIGNGWQPERFWWVKLQPEKVYAYGKTVPEAISKAALIAKLGEASHV